MRQPEGQLKDACKALFQMNGFYFRNIVIGQIPGRKNPSKGILDSVVIKQGWVAFVEFKTETGTVSPEQQDFVRDWTSAGGRAFVVRSIDQAMAVIAKANSDLGKVTPPLRR